MVVVLVKVTFTATVQLIPEGVATVQFELAGPEQ